MWNKAPNFVYNHFLGGPFFSNHPLKQQIFVVVTVFKIVTIFRGMRIHEKGNKSCEIDKGIIL